MRGNNARLLALTVLMLGCLGTKAQGYYFSHVGSAEGLSQMEVKCMLQDAEGYMWFGTRNKLNRYDGESFRIYDCHDATRHRRNNNISSLFQDSRRRLWAGTDKGVYILQPDGETFQWLDAAAATPDSTRIEDWVENIVADGDGNIWLVVPNQGLFRYDADGVMHYYAFGDTTLTPLERSVQSICIGHDGRVWVATNGDGVFLYNRNADSFKQYLSDGRGETLARENIYKLCDHGDYLYIGIHEGRLRKLNKLTGIISDVDAPDVHYKIIRAMADIDGKLWVGTQAGVYVVDYDTERAIHLYHDPLLTWSLSDDYVTTLCCDGENGVWVGTGGGGINYMSRNAGRFTRYLPEPGEAYALADIKVGQLAEDRRRNIWMATEASGVCRIEAGERTFRRISPCRESLTHGHDAAGQVLSIACMDDEVWAGLFKHGIDRISTDGQHVSHYSMEAAGLHETSIYALCRHGADSVWVGNGWGLYAGTTVPGRLSSWTEGKEGFVHDILEDSRGRLWVCTLGSGVYLYGSDGTVQHFLNETGNARSLSSNSVSSITQTSSGDIWLSTDRGGICRYDGDGAFTTLSVAEGLPDDCAFKMVEDKDGFLWFGTGNGLVRLNPRDLSLRVLTMADGLPSTQFHYKSALAASSGELWFGTAAGLFSFYPEKLEAATTPPPVYITAATCGNHRREEQHTFPATDGREELRLRHDMTTVTIRFIALSYVYPKGNRYRYRLTGVDNEWRETTHGATATYANLAPGEYLFQVRACSGDGVWNNVGDSLTIVIPRAWWCSYPALAAYLLLFLALAILSARATRTKLRRREERKREVYEIERERELYRSKVDFFIDIVHEIRTPLALINGPLDALEELHLTDQEAVRDIQLIRKNSNVLMTLVSQVLDLRKLELGKTTVHRVPTDVRTVVESVLHDFAIKADDERRTLTFQPAPGPAMAAIDRNLMSSILYNLLSNAIKYSEKHISVTVTADAAAGTVQVAVENDGPTIPYDEQQLVFEPFYQCSLNAKAEASSGIGLCIARSQAQLLKGTLAYSADDGTNRFTLTLPATSDGTTTEHAAAVGDTAPDDIVPNDEKDISGAIAGGTVLLVEDNDELNSFVASQLKHHFGVITATNGNDALRILQEQTVDMVLTDIMMPGMDGIALCRAIKDDIEISHIPVVILTAKNDIGSKIQGLEAGAEAYIEKPFSIKYLVTQLSTIMQNRRLQIENFNRKPYATSPLMGLSPADEEWLQKVIDIIEKNVAESNFGVELLSELCNMSRSSLHRKIKAVTGSAPTDFIRTIRLKKASKLIADGYYQVSEVCYLVGINSPSYFIKLFQKQFGMTPKEYEKMQKERIKAIDN